MKNEQTLQTERLLRLTDVIEMVGLRRSAVYKLIKEGKFPPPVKIGSRVSVWAQSAIADWIQRVLNA